MKAICLSFDPETPHDGITVWGLENHPYDSPRQYAGMLWKHQHGGYLAGKEISRSLQVDAGTVWPDLISAVVALTAAGNQEVIE